MPLTRRSEIQSVSRRVFLSVAAVVAPAAWPTDFPGEERLHRLIVPAEPGGGIDFVARLLARALSEHRLSVVVVNRPGASGLIGTTSVGIAKPDGLTLLVTGVSHLTGPLLYGTPAYDPLLDFVAVARLATTPNVLLVGAALRGLDVAQVLRDPRSARQGFSFASAGYGHTSHLAAEVFMGRTGANWLHVPFKGTAPALRALQAGEVDIMFAPLGSVAAATATGRVVALAIAHQERWQVLRETPTLRELGITNAEFSQWYAVFAPKGTSPDAVRALATLVLVSFGDPAVVSQLRSQGIEPAVLGPEKFAAFLLQEHRRLASLIRAQQPDRPAS